VVKSCRGHGASNWNTTGRIDFETDATDGNNGNAACGNGHARKDQHSVFLKVTAGLNPTRPPSSLSAFLTHIDLHTVFHLDNDGPSWTGNGGG
jgi:hypothetical protein